MSTLNNLMAEHEALLAQAQTAFELGSPYLTLADGWNEVDSRDGFTVSIHPTDVEIVAKLEGPINKNPRFVARFISGNWVTLRNTHLKTPGSTEYVKDFEDKSHVIKEVTTIPGLGEVTQYKYFCHRAGEDGSISVIGKTADLPEYPQANIHLNFFILHVTPTETGSNLKIVIQSQSTVQLDAETKREIGREVAHFYLSVISEVQAAPAE